MTFWIITFALALVVSAVLILVLLRGRPHAAGAGGAAGAAEPAAAYDLQVYRDQLRDVDRDLARGVIGEADAERVRVEVSRRILAADARIQNPGTDQETSRTFTRIMATILALVLILGSAGIYRALGQPGYGDLGLERRIELAERASQQRPGQAQAETEMPAEPALELDPDYATLIKQLRDTVAQRPDDLAGQRLLAQHEARSGNYNAAHQAQAKVIELMGDTAGAEEFGTYAELLIAAARGYVSPEAEAALRTTLTLDPRNGPSRYYWGMLQAQNGRPDLAFRVWARALRDGPPNAPWIAPIRAQIGEMAWRAGVEFTLPDLPPEPRSETQPAAPDLAGPSAADLDSAADMSAQDQQEMIRGMVDRLSTRLADEGGSPAEWSRLIGALAVLGETAQAQTIFDEAKGLFGDNAAALDQVTQAAQRAGLNL